MKQLKLPLLEIKGWSGPPCGGSGDKPAEIREVWLSVEYNYYRLEGTCPVCGRWFGLTKKSERLPRHINKVTNE